MRRFFITSFIILVVLLGLVIGLAHFYLPPYVKSLIETQGSQALGSPVKVQEVGLSYWPPGVKVSQLSFDYQGFVGVTLPQIRIGADISEIFSRSMFVQVELGQPQVKISLLKPLPTAQASRPSETQSQTSASEPLPIAVRVRLKLLDGKVSVQLDEKSRVDLEKLNLGLEFLDLSKPLTFDLQTQLLMQKEQMKIMLPVAIKSSMAVSESQISSESTLMNLGGLSLKLSGGSKLKPLKGQWNIVAEVEKLEALPMPPEFLPPGKWQGGVFVNAVATHEEAKPPQIKGTLKLKDLVGDTYFKNDTANFEGVIKASMQTGFEYNTKFSMQGFTGIVDLTELDILIHKQFKKPRTVPFKLEVLASQQGTELLIQKAEFLFAQIKAQASGKLSSESTGYSNVSIQVPPTPLNGLEKYLLAAGGEPIQGTLSVSAKLEGQLQKPEQLNVSLNPLSLKGFRARLQFDKEDSALSGPVTADLNAVLVAQGRNLKSAQVSLKSDLTGLQVMKKDLFQKKTGEILKADLVANQKGSLLSIRQGVLTTPAGTLNMSGTLQDPQRPRFDIRSSIPKLDLKKLSAWLPLLSKYQVTGDVHWSGRLAGTYDFAKGLESSPLKLEGKVKANIPQYVFKSAAPTAKSDVDDRKTHDESKPRAKPLPILPSWPIFKLMNLAMEGDLNRLHYNDLAINGIGFKGKLVAGVFSGNLKVAQVFSGQAQMTGFQTNLLQPQPSTSFTAQVSKLDLKQALNWVSPQWKDLASGRATGTLQVNAVHPSRDDFLETTWVKGDWNIADGFLSTLKFDQIINEKLAKVPGLGGKTLVASKGVTSDIEAKFEYAKSKLNFSKLRMVTPERNELNSSGWVKVDKTMDLSGTAHLAQAAVPEKVLKYNSDSSGRLVLPIRFTGSVLDPELNLLDTTVKQLVENTAKGEINEVKKQAESRAKAEVQKQIDTQKENLKNQAVDKLKGLFGQ